MGCFKKLSPYLLTAVIVLLCFVLLPTNAQAATEGYYTYRVVGNSYVSITGIDASVSGDLVIPSSLGGYPVTEIKVYFSGCENLTGVTIPDSVTTVREYTFENCKNLKSVTLGVGIKTVSKGMFYGCTSLTDVTLGENVTLIENSVFNGCTALTEITIPEGVTEIGDCAFFDCTALTNITIPEGVTTLGREVFHNCTNLSSIEIPDSLRTIGGYAFEGTAITEFTIPKSMTYVSQNMLGGCPDLVTVVFHDKVTQIRAAVFADCTSLKNVAFPEGAVIQFTSMFLNCTALERFSVPEGTTDISWAFQNCTGLTEVTLPSSLTSINGAFLNCTSLQTVNYTGTQEQWDALIAASDTSTNTELLNAQVNYNYVVTCNHSYTGVVTKEPTKTETGIKTYTCSVCGDSYTEVLPALFYGTNIDMGNSLDMNFYFYKGVIETLELEHVVEFVRTFADGSAETTYVPLSRFVLNGDYYQIVYPGLSAAEMNDTVSITVCHKNERISETKTDSMCSYVRRALDQITDPVSRRMYVDMLSYGAAAQINFGYDTEHLATDILTEEEKAEGTQSLAAVTNGYTRSNTNYYGTNFDLENEIKLNLYVLASAIGENGYAEITYTNFKGEEITKTVTEYAANGDYYMFTPDFVVGADGRCLLNIQFCKADGTKVVAVTDSMESYVARAVEKDPEKYGWMQKMMIYSDSARAYLNK